MSNCIKGCYYCVSDEPAFPEAFANVPTQYHNTIIPNFNVKICVYFIQRCPCGCGFPCLINNIPSPSPLSSHSISCSKFFKTASTFLRRHLSHDLIQPQVLDLLVPKLIDKARQFCNKIMENDSSSSSSSSSSSHPYVLEDRLAVFPLCIDVFVELLDVSERRKIPASEEAIQSLNNMRLKEEDDDIDLNEKNECCICLEDFRHNREISTMPCQHIFHYNCIVTWLNTSHLCPMCRYPMPVDDNSLECC